MFPASAICVNPLGGIISSLIGRRLCFIAFAVICTFGWITIAVVSPNIASLFIGRLLKSLGACGLSATISKIYKICRLEKYEESLISIKKHT